MNAYRFPKDFVWGSATAAIQIEGAASEDGKGPSQWDTFCKNNPEKIYGGVTPEVACDHYHRFKEDVLLMKQTGHKGYRLSIAWTRIFPKGFGEVNAQGVKFYKELFHELSTHGIEPNVTLYHWDLPQPLAERGGWENKETIEHFVNFARTCFELFGKEVRLWSTLNEPGWTTLQSYVTGLHPPNKTNYRAAIQVAHNYMVAHARVVKEYHKLKLGGQIGLVLNMSTVYPATKDKKDVDAAHRADGILNRWFIDPAIKGEYPEDTWSFYKEKNILPEHTQEELNLFKEDTIDFIGVNYYYPHYASADATEDAYHLNTSGNKNEDCKFSIKGVFKFVKNPKGKYTDWGWEINPEALYELLLRAHQYRPNIPVYITENGVGLQEELQGETVQDDARIEFVSEHRKVAHKALEARVNLKGYYMWALMDNFSWVNGYKKRYGFLFVDRKTQNRYIKKSGYWYKELSETGILKA